MRIHGCREVLAVAFAVAFGAGCSSAGPTEQALTGSAAVDAVREASSDLGSPVATIPASAAGVSQWEIYAKVADDGTSSLTVLGVDATGTVVAESLFLPDQGVAGVGTSNPATESDAQALAASVATDVQAYVGSGPPDGTGTSSIHTLGNPFGLSNCTYDVLSVIGSIAGTVSGTLGAFATCPVTVGVGCVAGVVMTLSGAIGVQAPSCMEQSPFNDCYEDCAGGSDDARTAFASCATSGLATTADAGSDAGSDVCQPLVGCFDVF